jgi:hypothetical protein
MVEGPRGNIFGYPGMYIKYHLACQIIFDYILEVRLLRIDIREKNLMIGDL